MNCCEVHKTTSLKPKFDALLHKGRLFELIGTQTLSFMNQKVITDGADSFVNIGIGACSYLTNMLRTVTAYW